MTVLDTLNVVLNEQFEAFRNNEADRFEMASQLLGAARLAEAIAYLHSDQELLALAQHIRIWIADWEAGVDLLEMYECEHAQEKLDSRKQIERETFRLIKDFVGKEHLNPHWKRLVEVYQAEFPTFTVRESVYERIGSKTQAARLRTLLGARISALRLGRIPFSYELEDILPIALDDLTEQTLSYLEKVLPGFEFLTQLLSTDSKDALSSAP